MIVLARLRDGDAIESDVTLTEQGMKEILVTPTYVRKVNIHLPRR